MPEVLNEMVASDSRQDSCRDADMNQEREYKVATNRMEPLVVPSAVERSTMERSMMGGRFWRIQ